MKVIAVDIGNTSIDCGWVDNHEVLLQKKLSTKQFIQDAAFPFLSECQSKGYCFDAIAMTSVVPKATELFHKCVASKGFHVFELQIKTCFGLFFLSAFPEKIGGDLLASSIAAQKLYSSPTLIIDVGTATTLHVVSSRGYEGCIIAPGLSMMLDALHEKTALLPRLSERELILEPIWGRSTSDAISIGMTIGFNGMLDALIRHAMRAFSHFSESDFTIIATGGGIHRLPPIWADKIYIDPHLTLKGLSIAYERYTAS